MNRKQRLRIPSFVFSILHFFIFALFLVILTSIENKQDIVQYFFSTPELILITVVTLFLPVVFSLLFLFIGPFLLIFLPLYNSFYSFRLKKSRAKFLRFCGWFFLILNFMCLLIGIFVTIQS